LIRSKFQKRAKKKRLLSATITQKNLFQGYIITLIIQMKALKVQIKGFYQLGMT